MMPPEGRPAHWRWLLLASLVAATLFFQRGVVRALDRGLRDFAGPLAGTRLFWTGGNPYDATALLATLDRMGATDQAPPPAVYPAATFVALAPLAVLPAQAAKLLFLASGLIFLAIGVRGWAQELRLSPNQTGLVCALILAGSHLHTALFVANPGLAAVGAVLAGTWYMQQRREKIASALLLWALLLKPQLGIVGVAWLLFQGRFRRSLAIAALGASSAALSIAYLYFHVPEALTQWRANAIAEHTSGSIAATGSLGIHRVDPAGLWAGLTGSDLPAMALIAIALVYLIIAFAALKRSGNSADPAANLALLGMSALLASYHRAYDAVLLIPAWLVAATPAVSPAIRTISALCCAAWVLPGGGFWTTLAANHPLVPAGLAQSPLANLLLARIHAWALLATAAVLILALYRKQAPAKTT